MWPRVTEVLLAIWLLASPFIFSHPSDRWGWWASDLVSAGLMIILALLCYSWRYAHLGQILVGFWLVGFGYLAGSHPNPPALQNEIVIGLTLLMVAIIPNEASQPPPSWRPYLESARGPSSN